MSITKKEGVEIIRTLIINGSPKKKGDTEALVNAFVSHLKGEVKIISSQNNISPCMDCRFCWENIGCKINDEMQDIYKFLKICDNIVFASPIWFSSLSGPFLNITSRIQAIWAADYFQNKTIPMKEKKGVVILAGGQPQTAEIPTKTAIGIMRYLNVHRPSVEKIYSLDTNNVPAKEDKTALNRCKEVAELLNQT